MKSCPWTTRTYLPLIDRGGESSIVELETRGFCLPDERAILSGASRYPSSFSRSRPRRRQRRQAGPRTRTSGGRVSDINELHVIWRGSHHVRRPGGRNGRSQAASPCENRQVSENLDADLETLDRAGLVAEIRRLRAGIRRHRDSSGHDLCWHHPELWGLLPEQIEPAVAVPPWPKFLRGCVAYRQALERELPRAGVHDAEYSDPAPQP